VSSHIRLVGEGSSGLDSIGSDNVSSNSGRRLNEGSAMDQIDEDDYAPLRIGDRIEARYQGGSRWLSGKITDKSYRGMLKRYMM
jgi:hypothetical protein